MFIFDLFFSLMLAAQLSYAAEPGPDVLLDVRTPSEFSQAHIKDSMNIDFKAEDFKDRVEKLDRDKSYGVYCGSGNRAGKAVSLMKSLGFKKIRNVGGIADVAKAYKRPCEGTNPEKCQ